MLISLLAGLALTAHSFGPSKTQIVEYKDGAQACDGFMASPESSGTHPAVIIVHQWAGLTDYEKYRAGMLADLGYVGFCADIYGKGNKPMTMQERGVQAGKYKGDRQLYRSRLLAAYHTLSVMPGVDKTKIAVIGYCFGGTGALELGRAGADLKAIVSFHGGLDNPTPADAANIRCPVLICHGAIDPNVPPSQVAAFQKEMEDAKKDYVFVAYSGAVHAFTQKEAGSDPSKGAAYNESADKRSWEEMKRFLSAAFGSSSQ